MEEKKIYKHYLIIFVFQDIEGGTISVSSGCCDTIPQAAWLSQEAWVLQAGKSELQPQQGW